MPSRRRFLAACSLAVAGGAGCTDRPSLGGSTAAETDDGNADTGDDRVLFAVSDGDEEVELATYDDVATVGEISESRTSDGYQLPITLSDEGADAFADGLETAGALDDPQAHEIRTYRDGEVVHTATLGPELAAAIEDGDWDADPILLNFADRETAAEMRDALDGA